MLGRSTVGVVIYVPNLRLQSAAALYKSLDLGPTVLRMLTSSNQ